jgi:hypothetical protein
VSERAAWLGNTLHTAASEYHQAEQRLHGQLGRGDGGPA